MQRIREFLNSENNSFGFVNLDGFSFRRLTRNNLLRYDLSETGADLNRCLEVLNAKDKILAFGIGRKIKSVYFLKLGKDKVECDETYISDSVNFDDRSVMKDNIIYMIAREVCSKRRYKSGSFFGKLTPQLEYSGIGSSVAVTLSIFATVSAIGYLKFGVILPGVLAGAMLGLMFGVPMAFRTRRKAVV